MARPRTKTTGRARRTRTRSSPLADTAGCGGDGSSSSDARKFFGAISKVMQRMKPLAIVIPWFGAELKGGAEQQAFQVATRLAARGVRVEVLTTCCRSFQDDWATNHLPPGITKEHGLTVRRLPGGARASPAVGAGHARRAGGARAPRPSLPRRRARP